MAGVSDTAKLIASLELQDKFSRTADRFGQRVAGMERQTSTLGRIGGQINSGLAAAATNLTRIGVIGGGLLGVGIARGIASLQELEEVQVATRTVIESTGAAAGVTAEKVRLLAEKYEGLNSTMDDKVIQSAENLLLTFTNITGKAFEPALEAALNMNEAMGGGPEGLQNTVIQLGKALQDPVKGFTALRRIGVNLSPEQQKQIKLLVEQNDLYGAQRVILDELSTEFGGRFVAAGTTATAKFAKLRDAVEDAQMALATAFLPVLSKVSEKLTTFLADPKVLAQIQDFGEGLADGFDDVVQFAGKVPWESIGTSLQIAGAGAKILLDAFVSLPPWVQTAVITGWGLNKLTGGALGGIVGELGKNLIKGVLGLNAGVVNINAATVNGGIPGVGGVPGAGVKGGGVPLPVVIVAGAAAVVGAAGVTQESRVAGNRQLGLRDDQSIIDAFLEGSDEQVTASRAASSSANAWSARQMAAFAQVTAAQRTTAGKTGELVGRVSALNGTTAAGFNNLSGAIRSKRNNIVVKVDVTSNVSVDTIQRRLTASRVATGTISEF